MEYVTACYRQKEAEARIFLTLQQRKYRRKNVSMVGACIADTREQLISLQNFIEEECNVIDARKDHQEEGIKERWMEYLAEQKASVGSFAGILCMDDKVALLSRGNMQICFFFHRFGRTTWKIQTEPCRVGRIEPDTAILLADHAFLNFTESRLADCLGPGKLREDSLQKMAQGADRHLLELGKMAEQSGGMHMGAAWILPVKGGKRGG